MNIETFKFDAAEQEDEEEEEEEEGEEEMKLLRRDKRVCKSPIC